MIIKYLIAFMNNKYKKDGLLQIHVPPLRLCPNRPRTTGRALAQRRKLPPRHALRGCNSNPSGRTYKLSTQTRNSHPLYRSPRESSRHRRPPDSSAMADRGRSATINPFFGESFGLYVAGKATYRLRPPQSSVPDSSLYAPAYFDGKVNTQNPLGYIM